MDVNLYNIFISFCFIGLLVPTAAVRISETDDEDLYQRFRVRRSAKFTAVTMNSLSTKVSTIDTDKVHDWETDFEFDDEIGGSGDDAVPVSDIDDKSYEESEDGGWTDFEPLTRHSPSTNKFGGKERTAYHSPVSMHSVAMKKSTTTKERKGTSKPPSTKKSTATKKNKGTSKPEPTKKSTTKKERTSTTKPASKKKSTTTKERTSTSKPASTKKSNTTKKTNESRTKNTPSRPELTKVACGQREANVMWKSMKNHENPILSYTIKYNNSVSPKAWQIAVKDIPATESSRTVALSPWTNYTFRIIASNKIGSSAPSNISDICSTPPDVPFKNPDNVRVHRAKPRNLIISWNPLAKKDHNGPGLKYKVEWRQDNGSSGWDFKEVNKNKFTITHHQTIFPYLVRVWAVNAIGQSNIIPKEVGEYAGQYVTTRHCNKIKDLPKQKKCLQDLKSVLTSSDPDLNSDDVLHVMEIFEEVTVEDDDSCSRSEYDVLETSKLVYNLTSKANVNTPNPDWANLTNAVLNVFGNLIVNQCQWKKVTKDERPNVFTQFLEVLDSATLNLAEKTANNKNDSKLFYPLENKDTTKSKIVVYLGAIGQKEDNFTGSDIYVDDENPSPSSISVQIDPEQRNSLNSQSRLNYAVLIRPIYMESIINNTIESMDENGIHSYSQSRDFNGKLVSMTFDKSIQLKNPKVRIQFAHTYKEVGHSKIVYRRKLHTGEQKKSVTGSSICAYWDIENNIWSTFGCQKNMSNSFTTICECNHLTTFSVLAEFHEYSALYNYILFYGSKEKDFGLQFLTWTLGTLSILCLVLSLTSFALDRQTKNEERKITIHLCANLLAEKIFLIFGDRNIFYFSNATCTAFGILTHFSGLCTFGWISVEGIHLYFQVVKIFPLKASHLFKVYCFIGYGIPFLLVAITILIGLSSATENIYAGVMFCWLQGSYRWAFMVPALLICMGSVIVLFSAFHTVKKPKTTAASSDAAYKKSKSNRTLIKGTISLTIILGVSWIFGVLSLVDVQGHIFLSYMFTILNASQGMFVFIFYFCLNKPLRYSTGRFLMQAITSFSSKRFKISEVNTTYL